jgi:hypothetical protein
MSFQAYLDALETKSGRTPRELLALAAERGLQGPSTRSAPVIDWLRDDYGIGRGHAVALLHVIKRIDESGHLWLDGKESRPKP